MIVEPIPGLLAWQQKIMPHIPARHLRELLRGLEADDPRLIQGGVHEPGVALGDDQPCEGACAMSYGAWLADGLSTIGHVGQHWSDLACRVRLEAEDMGHALNEFLHFYDRRPRAEVVPALAAAVRAELARRTPTVKE